MLQTIVHYSLHLVFPVIIAYVFFRDNWKKVYLIFLLTMLVDLDHLLVSPIFDPERCSIGFHYLHSCIAIFVYLILAFLKKTRVAALGLIMHMLTDLFDCLWMNGWCIKCVVENI